MYIDIHCHPNFGDYDDDRERVLRSMAEDGVFGICVGTDAKTSKESANLADRYGHIYASVGLHPTRRKEGFDESFYSGLLENKKIVAIGECGLDYFRRDFSETEKIKQEEILAQQIDFSVRKNLPLMIHCRPSSGRMDAYTDILSVLKEYAGKVRGNVHFFAGDGEVARRFLDIGFSMSFTGVITFAGNYDETVKYVPLDSIMSETDSPYVSPVPFRGRRNEPRYVKEVVKKIAAIKGISFEEARNAILANAGRMFGISFAKDKSVG